MPWWCRREKGTRKSGALRAAGDAAVKSERANHSPPPSPLGHPHTRAHTDADKARKNESKSRTMKVREPRREVTPAPKGQTSLISWPIFIAALPATVVKARMVVPFQLCKNFKSHGWRGWRLSRTTQNPKSRREWYDQDTGTTSNSSS